MTKSQLSAGPTMKSFTIFRKSFLPDGTLSFWKKSRFGIFDAQTLREITSERDEPQSFRNDITVSGFSFERRSSSRTSERETVSERLGSKVILAGLP